MDKSAIRRFAGISSRKERRRAKRIIIKKLRAGTIFKTGTGKVHKVIKLTETHICIQSLESGGTVRIPIDNIKKMLVYFFRIRIVERKELEVFHHYNSILFGILATSYDKKVKISRVGKLLRLIIIGVRVYLAGGEKCPGDLEMASNAGARYVLFSYFYIRKGKAWKEYLKRYNLRCILDCGSFTEWMARQKGKNVKPIDLDEYINFIKENSDVIEHYFCKDEIGDHKKTMENLRYMESCGLTPIPVFHMSTDLAELDKLVMEYPVIGIGGTVNQKNREGFLKEVFLRYPKIAFHGLGITKADILMNYPFFSVDSSAWLNSRRDDKAKVLTKDGQVKRTDLSVIERVAQSIKFLSSLELPKTFQGITLIGEQISFSFYNKNVYACKQKSHTKRDNTTCY